MSAFSLDSKRICQKTLEIIRHFFHKKIFTFTCVRRQLTHVSVTLFVFAMKGFVKNILNFPMMEPEIAVMAENVSKIP